MRNRRLLWCLVAGVLLLLAGGALFLVVRVLPDRITPENCDRIEVGMTEREVEAILGRPADDSFDAGASFWRGERWIIVIHTDDQRGVVAEKACYEMTDGFRDMMGSPPTFWQKVRGALGW